MYYKKNAEKIFETDWRHFCKNPKKCVCFWKRNILKAKVRAICKFCNRNGVPNGCLIYKKSYLSILECSRWRIWKKIQLVNLAGDLNKTISCLKLTHCTFQNISVHAQLLPMCVWIDCTQPRHSKTFLTTSFQKHHITVCLASGQFGIPLSKNYIYSNGIFYKWVKRQMVDIGLADSYSLGILKTLRIKLWNWGVNTKEIM